MSKVVLKGYIVVPDSDLAAVNVELPVHAELSRLEEGCVVFEVTPNDTVKNRFHFYEEFVDTKAFSHHKQRTSESKWDSVAKNIEKHFEITGLDE